MMNYQYIEQLLDCYWEGKTTLEEEQILRMFFSQPDIPENMRQYAPLFQYEASQSEEKLGEEFDERMESLLEHENTVKAKHIKLSDRFAPILKAAAVVAVAITIGNISERTMQMNSVVPITVQTGDTYIKKEDITAKIKIIDQNKSDVIARNDSLGNHSSTPGQKDVIYE